MQELYILLLERHGCVIWLVNILYETHTHLSVFVEILLVMIHMTLHNLL